MSSQNETRKGCFNCSCKKILDDIYYTCTESQSAPNVHSTVRYPHRKFTGLIKDLNKISHLGSSCLYWRNDKEKVKVTFT